MEWFEDEAFWREMQSHMFDEARWERALEEVDGVRKLLGLPDGGHVLDLCCGPGRHSLAFFQRGHRVTGVDLNEEYLAAARAKGPEIEWVRCDMREFVRERAFDAAVNLFSSFAYFEDQDDERRVARNVRASLKPGGRFAIDTMSKEVLARKYQPRRWSRREDGVIMLEEVEIIDGWRGVRTTWTRIRENEREAFFFYNRLYSGVELETLLLAAGFAEVALYGW